MICNLALLAAVLSLGTHLVASVPADFELTASRTIASVVPDWPETVVASDLLNDEPDVSSNFVLKRETNAERMKR